MRMWLDSVVEINPKKPQQIFFLDRVPCSLTKDSRDA